MTIENDKKLYIGLFKSLTNPCGYDNEYRVMYQKCLQEIEEEYGEEATRRWIEEEGLYINKCI